jgi:dUTP pyrophosphatase
MKGEGYGVEFNPEKVRRLIAEQGLSVNKFALQIGWSGSQLCNLLKTGRARPGTLDQIAYGLGCEIRDLLCDEVKPISKIKVKLSPGGIMPTRAHSTDAGLDLYSPIDVLIPCNDNWYGCSVVIDTLTHVAIPVGYVGDVKSKSGLMMEYGIITDGTVDAGYTGSIRVKLFNHGLCDVKIQKGQKIAQLVIKKIITPELELVDSLEETERGANGFGSTGKF